MRRSCRRNVQQEDIKGAMLYESSWTKHKGVPNKSLLPEVRETPGEGSRIQEGASGGLWEFLELFCDLVTGYMCVFTL